MPFVQDYLWKQTKKMVIRQLKAAGTGIKDGAIELTQQLLETTRETIREGVTTVADAGRAAMGRDPLGTIPYLDKPPPM